MCAGAGHEAPCAFKTGPQATKSPTSERKLVILIGGVAFCNTSYTLIRCNICQIINNPLPSTGIFQKISCIANMVHIANNSVSTIHHEAICLYNGKLSGNLRKKGIVTSVKTRRKGLRNFSWMIGEKKQQCDIRVDFLQLSDGCRSYVIKIPPASHNECTNPQFCVVLFCYG